MDPIESITQMNEEHRQAVVELMQALLNDLAALRAMDVDTAEPAFCYHAEESQS